MSDDHIAITTLILLGIWTAAAYARRYFRTLPDYCVTPLGPEVRPESYAEHADEAMRLANCDPIGALFDQWHDQAVEFAAEVMATIEALCDPEVAE